MFIRPSLITLIALIATPSFAGANGQHSAQSVDHSAQATSHGSAAVVTGAAAVIAVPIVAFGSVFTVSGAAIEEVGEGSVTAGTELLRAGTGQPTNNPVIKADGAPTLD
jgi:hypothetical protein